MRLPTTKNSEPRVVPLVGRLRELFEGRRARRSITLSDQSVYLAELVFHRGGKRISDPRRSWEKALNEVGVARHTWHGFRRTAARNMVNAGVPEKIAMQITGHKTVSIFRRYHIVAQADKAAALEKTFAHVESERVERAVTPLRKAESKGRAMTRRGTKATYGRSGLCV